MIKTTYICDKCGKEVEKNTDLIYLNVQIGDGRFVYNYNPLRKDHQYSGVHWCQECCTKIGIVQKPNAPIIAPDSPTIEDMIYEIVQNAIENHRNAS